MRKLLQNSVFLIFIFSFSFLTAQEAEYGMASYYGDEFHGSETASGQRYDKNAMTAAHKTLPMGTVVRVTRLDTKKSVDVRINDRGPYLKGRIIDLSGKAAETLGMRSDGTTEVQVDILGKNGKVTTTSKKSVPKTVPTPKVKTAKVPVKKATPKPKAKPVTKKPEVYTSKGSTDKKTKAKESKTTYTPKKTKKVVKASSAEALEEGFELVTKKNFKPYGLFKIELARPKEAGYGVQIASLSSYENVLKQVASLQGKWFKNILVSIEPGASKQPNYKIILGPFPDQETADSYKRHAKKKGVNGFVVSLEDIEY